MAGVCVARFGPWEWLYSGVVLTLMCNATRNQDKPWLRKQSLLAREHPQGRKGNDDQQGLRLQYVHRAWICVSPRRLLKTSSVKRRRRRLRLRKTKHYRPRQASGVRGPRGRPKSLESRGGLSRGSVPSCPRPELRRHSCKAKWPRRSRTRNWRSANSSWQPPLRGVRSPRKMSRSSVINITHFRLPSPRSKRQANLPSSGKFI